MERSPTRSGTQRSDPTRAAGPFVYSIDETAEILRVSRATVIAMIERGDLPSTRYAHRRWIPARAVRALLLLDLPIQIRRSTRRTRPGMNRDDRQR